MEQLKKNGVRAKELYFTGKPYNPIQKGEKMKPRLESTRDYEMFDVHEFNRPLHEDRVLLESMQKNGFMPSSPIHCIQNGNNKLKVIRGHHRLYYAKRLNLPVWYVIDDTTIDIFALEAGRQQWNVSDFAQARANSGDEDVAKLLAFQKKHGLRLGSAASLLGGESAKSNNKIKSIKTGHFRIADNVKHAFAVVGITDACREVSIKFATSSAFVGAVSLALRVPEFEAKYFIHRIRLYPRKLEKRGTVYEYLEEIDAFYNYGAKLKGCPLAYKAREAAKKRNPVIQKAKP